MDQSLQEFLLSLFGGDAALFSSIWDIIQGIILIGGGTIAMIYRHRDTVSRAVAKLKTDEVVTLSSRLEGVQKQSSQELNKVKDTVSYLADIIVTLSLASPVLLDKAKQQIAGYASEIKNINGIELEGITKDIISAIKEGPSPKVTIQEETKVIIEEVKELKEEVKATEATIEDIISTIPL
jgi:hypothetical protein